MSGATDLTGMRFGRLTVMSKTRAKNGRVAWVCKCDCGNQSTPMTTSLLSGHTRSCGCLHTEVTGDVFRKHGRHGTRPYKIWSNMIQRCGNPKNDSYSLYGAKGITVCDEWKDFATFYEWATANGYADNLSIDRIKNDEGYCPENCRWATPKEQTDNRDCTRYITYNGKRQTVKAWSEETGIPYRRLLWRTQRNWPPERALEIKKEEE